MPPRILLPTPPWLLEPRHAAWPAGLNDLPDPPEALEIAGALPGDWARAVAIVGTRAANDDALAFARRLAAELAVSGAVVVSGGAAGIDGAAHLGALDVGGLTVAVLATGLTHAYPRHHAPLFSKIAEQGALVSELGCTSDPGGFQFLRRNRLIAALARSVVIVQAPRRSGALATARIAKRLKRRVLAVPAAPWDPRGQGCLELLRSGTEICTSAADILSLPPFDLASSAERRGRPGKQRSRDAGLEASAKAVWRRVRKGASYPDQISAALDMPAAEVQEALLALMLSGHCRQRADGAYESRGG